MTRITHKGLRERLETVAALAREQGLPLRIADGDYGKCGAVGVESSGYGYSVSITTKAGCSGTDLLSPAGLTAAECDAFLRGMAVALDLRRWMEYRGMVAGRIPQESAESRELAIYVENDRSRWPSICKTLSKHYVKGSFSLDRAIAYIERCGCAPAARGYVLEHGGMGDKWNVIFPKPCRLAAAESLARGLAAEFRMGNLWE